MNKSLLLHCHINQQVNMEVFAMSVRQGSSFYFHLLILKMDKAKIILTYSCSSLTH